MIFEIKDKTGKKIHLAEERWKHISQRHPNVTNYVYIEETLTTPFKIIYERDTAIYYKYYKDRKEPAKYLKVIVKYLMARDL